MMHFQLGIPAVRMPGRKVFCLLIGQSSRYVPFLAGTLFVLILVPIP